MSNDQENFRNYERQDSFSRQDHLPEHKRDDYTERMLERADMRRKELRELGAHCDNCSKKDSITAKEYQDLNIRLGLEIGKKQERIEELERVCAMALEELDADGVYGLDHVVTKLRTVLGEK